MSEEAHQIRLLHSGEDSNVNDEDFVDVKKSLDIYIYIFRMKTRDA